MIELIKIIDGIPKAYTSAAFRAANKHTVYGHVLSNKHLNAQGVYRVNAGPKPEEVIGFKVVQDAFPALVDGVWVQGYTSVELSADEARAVRNKALKDTDWMAVTDRTMTGPELAYRQGLRDVPQQAGFPKSVGWPNKPGVTP